MSVQVATPETATKPALEIKNVKLRYQTGNGAVEALNDISLTVREGEFVSILGPSGCGKSSLLKLILGLEQPTSGSLSLEGAPIKGPSKKIGAVFQSPILLPWRTVLENVLLPVEVMNLDLQSATERARSLLELTGLRSFEQRYPFELSGGMQQRASIVRALVHDPRILAMDEPFAALDALNRELMAVELQKVMLASRKTTIFITHSISEAVFLSDRIVVMSPRPGRIIEIFENKFPRPRHFPDLTNHDLSSLAARVRGCLDESRGG